MIRLRTHWKQSTPPPPGSLSSPSDHSRCRPRSRQPCRIDRPLFSLFLSEFRLVMSVRESFPWMTSLSFFFSPVVAISHSEINQLSISVESSSERRNLKSQCVHRTQHRHFCWAQSVATRFSFPHFHERLSFRVSPRCAYSTLVSLHCAYIACSVRPLSISVALHCAYTVFQVRRGAQTRQDAHADWH